MKRIPFKNIVLVGFKGCGKTRIGKLMAKSTGYEFLDIDSVIEDIFLKTHKKKMSVRSIFKTFGGDYFRKLEGKAILLSAKAKRSLISLGGGTPLNPVFKKNKFKGSTFVYLQVSPDILYKRIIRKGVPPFFDKKAPKKSFTSLFIQRTPVYSKIADFKIDNSTKPPAATCRDVLKMLKGKDE
jgi:shikimate kinase